MALPEKFAEYAHTVAEQIRWKRARRSVEREIETHLLDQMDALIDGGMSEDAAIDESLRRTGDAAEIGLALDRVHRPKPAWGLILLTLAISAVGFFLRHDLQAYDGFYSLPKELIILAVGAAAFVCAYFLDFTALMKFPLIFFFGTAGIVMSTGVLYSRFPMSPYVTQYVCILFPLAYAALVMKLRMRRYTGLVLAFAGLVLQGIACYAVPTSFGLLCTFVGGFVVLFAAAAGDQFGIGRRRTVIIVGCVLAAAIAFVAAAVLFKYRLSERFAAALHPELYADGIGWEAAQIRDALRSAKWIGAAEVGENRYLTLTTSSESMQVRLICKYGWLAFCALMALFMLFFALAARLCIKRKNIFGRLSSLAVLTTLALQTAAYVSSGLGYTFFNSYSLPLISSGGTALVINMALIGHMLSVFRSGNLSDGAAYDRYADTKKPLCSPGGERTISVFGFDISIHRSPRRNTQA